ncbi:arabinan endo-1,5-alpha-L-arabinosidase [Oceanobacillus bengalensis]|uniref:Arabinan endo-1,5-alpha-L-arabinosidase n=1 Tax=Oceanobacillus bengalensis TaxID=1435466 RepID=A0A494YZN7_9BACI|nr:arabinan endo-1,5-alpha-L-arabinosidase [Oceanobacillus bengalensis]RKQ15682.1 arabinan endo-1,5-alpha-L-arabinosidase [Oceanobacillus bengalensis]
MIDSNNIPNETICDRANLYDETKWTTVNAHDPAIYKDGGWYYVFSTDAQIEGEAKPGIQIRKSRDLINWQWVGRAFNEVPPPAKEWTGAKGLWAPDVTKFGETYYLYYAASQFGKSQSFIGVATSKNIEGPWEDQGEVFKTKHGEEGPNAIDPNITFDENGKPWMVYGSFFGGIFVAEINPTTGKLREYGRGNLIAKRQISVEGAIEGPYIVYHPKLKYYYLFVSYDSLASNYNIRVARSKSISGPYVDLNGNEMTNTMISPNDVGLKILGGYKFQHTEGWVAPGHNSVLKDGDNYYVCHHIRTKKDKRWHYLHIRKVVWTNDGWPLVSPERYAGEEEVPIQRNEISGYWEYICMDKDNNDQIESQLIQVSDGKNNQLEAWKQLSNNRFILSLKDKEIEGIVMPGWDWEEWHQTLVFMGKDKHGDVILAKKKMYE